MQSCRHEKRSHQLLYVISHVSEIIDRQDLRQLKVVAIMMEHRKSPCGRSKCYKTSTHSSLDLYRLVPSLWLPSATSRKVLLRTNSCPLTLYKSAMRS